MKSSSECYKIMHLSWQKVGAAGTTTHVSETIPVHLRPDSPAAKIYNVYIESYDLVPLSHSYTPQSGILI